MQIETNRNLAKVSAENITGLLDEKVKKTDDIKTAIDILATKTALEDNATIGKVVAEKSEELRNDAESKRINAETLRIKEEVEKVRQQKQKEIEEFDKQITAKRKEVEQLKAETDKAQAFFENNAEILKYIGVRSKKTLNVMKVLIVPATIIFAIIQVLLFPLTLTGVVLESIVNIVGGICGAIKNNALKIVLSISVIILVLGVTFTLYYFGGKLIGN